MVNFLNPFLFYEIDSFSSLFYQGISSWKTGAFLD